MNGNTASADHKQAVDTIPQVLHSCLASMTQSNQQAPPPRILENFTMAQQTSLETQPSDRTVLGPQDSHVSANLSQEGNVTLAQLKEVTTSNSATLENCVSKHFGSVSFFDSDDTRIGQVNFSDGKVAASAKVDNPKTLEKPSEKPATPELDANGRQKLPADQDLSLADKTIAGIRQGNYGDCHFVSAMQDVAMKNGVDALKKLISPAPEAKWMGKTQSDGKPDQTDPDGHWSEYNVQFYGINKPVTVSWDKDVQYSTGAFDNITPGHLTEGENSRYPAILEAAAGKVYADTKWGTTGDPSKPYDKADPTMNMQVAPGSAGHDLGLLTGQDSVIFRTDLGMTQDQNNQRNADIALLKEDSLRGFIFADENALLGVGKDAQTPVKPVLPNDMAAQIKETLDKGGYVTAVSGPHAFSVLDVTADHEFAIVRNPQHQHLPSTDEHGEVFPHAKVDSNGNAEIPMDEFVKSFSEVYETKP
jgi:hypothetical protein